MNLYIGNLSYSSTENDIRTAFGAYGEVSEVRLITDRDTGRSKGFGFVEMPNAQEAQAAIQGLNGKELQGRTVTVNEAKPREAGGRPQGGGAGRGGFRGGSGGGGRW